MRTPIGVKTTLSVSGGALTPPDAAFKVHALHQHGAGAHRRARAAVRAGGNPGTSKAPVEAGKAGPRCELCSEAELDAGLWALERPEVPWEDVILVQGFGWRTWKTNPLTKEPYGPEENFYRCMKGHVEELEATGATHIWLPPPSKSVAAEGYMPSQLYDLDTKYGSKQDLLDLNKVLLQAGISPVLDVVINHRSADAQAERGLWNRFKDTVEHKGRRIDWGRWAITCDDPDYGGKGNADTGADFGPAPDLDHSNEEVRGGLSDWLAWLQTCIGFHGMRLDFATGYAPEFTREYIERAAAPGMFAVGEYFTNLDWEGSHLSYNQDRTRQAIVDWAKSAKHAAAFDFVLKGQLQEAVRNTEFDRLRDKDGRPPGINGWAPNKACTFADNHDTGSSQRQWPFPSERIMLAYAYIMTHPGIPCVFGEHLIRWKLMEEIKELIDIRKRNGIRADCKVDIQAADKDMYVAAINDRVVVKLGPRFDMGALLPKESAGWKMAASGDDYAIWEKCA